MASDDTRQSVVHLQVENLRKVFETVSGRLEVLSGTDVSLDRGQMMAVTGPSGSGKSTLLYIIGTLDQPTDGRVLVGGVDPFTHDEVGLAAFRNEHVGFIFQDHHLLPQCTVLENVLLPLLAGAGVGPEADQWGRELLDRVGLADRIAHRPAQLSGGERQRVAVCRSLINRPSLLLADEPTGNLDRATAEAVGSLLLEIGREQNTALICVTHSLELAKRFPLHCELVDGRLVDAGDVQ